MRIRILFLALALCYSLSVAGQAIARCSHPRLQQAEVGGDRLVGVVVLQGQPVQQALVQVYSSTEWLWIPGKTVWEGRTDNGGGFTTKKLAAGSYRLEVFGWGVETVKLNPKIEGPGHPHYQLVLTMDDGRISWVAWTN